MWFVIACIASSIAGTLGTLLVRAKQALVRPVPPGCPVHRRRNRGESVRRVLKHLQRKTIGELEEGTAAVVVGVVRAIPGVALLRSPATNTECLGYHLDIRGAQHEMRLDMTLRIPQVHEEARCVALEVHDPTGALRVGSRGTRARDHRRADERLRARR